MRLKELLSFTKSNLSNLSQIDAEFIVSHVFSFNKRESLIFNADQTVTAEQLTECKKLIQRRNLGEPVSYIVGKKDFWDYTFLVNEHVLIPRADSELLIESVMQRFKDKDGKLKILELGVGSGCLIITLLKIYAHSIGVGVDISNKALDVAKKNSKALHTSGRLSLLQSNWFQSINSETAFDIIICNPPYISEQEMEEIVGMEVKDYEPKIALTDGGDGLSNYRLIAKDMYKYLSKEGLAFFEVGYKQSEEVKNIFKSYNCKVLQVLCDLSGIKRTLVVACAK